MMITSQFLIDLLHRHSEEGAHIEDCNYRGWVQFDGELNPDSMVREINEAIRPGNEATS